MLLHDEDIVFSDEFAPNKLGVLFSVDSQNALRDRGVLSCKERHPNSPVRVSESAAGTDIRLTWCAMGLSMSLPRRLPSSSRMMLRARKPSRMEWQEKWEMC